MRFFGATALIFALITVCLSAQSERARQRSGPIKSVPVAADIKRDANFDCPEEFGYYPHPTDCTLYYVCVFGGALLESCTGGLMYSHELQTCDWPRNVGCDGASAPGTEELERISERDPPPRPPPRRAPPPPPPRAQPNPVVTSRGQPKFNRDEYEKQQQLYAEVDDLPPVEEIESDRQQRVYRGQPSTIGQVQKDRDGYSSPVVNSRTLNSNIIPASIPQSGKVGSFSFGTQVDDRRTATATPAPQTYSEEQTHIKTDKSIDRQLDIAVNTVDDSNVTERLLKRHKRETKPKSNSTSSNTTNIKVSNRNDGKMEYIDLGFDFEDEEEQDDENLEQDDVERGKRQIRPYLKNGFKNPGKIWSNSKPIKFVDIQQYNFNPNQQNNRYHQNYHSGSNTNNYHEGNQKPYLDNNYYSQINPFAAYQNVENQSQRPFKASLPDLFNQKQHVPLNAATQIITKSPPISALQNNDNRYSLLAAGFYNNVQNIPNNQQIQNNNQYGQLPQNSVNRPNNLVSFHDSSLLPTTQVTAKPVKILTSPQPQTKYRINPIQNSNNDQSQRQVYNPVKKVKIISDQESHTPQSPAEYQESEEQEEDEDESQEEEESDENDDHYYKHDFPNPPYEFTHPRNKYANIENPFASQSFNFDEFIAKLREHHYSTTENPKINQQNVAIKIINSPTEHSHNDNSGKGIKSTTPYQSMSMSTPRPFSVLTGPNGVTNSEYFSQMPLTTELPGKFQKLIQQANQQYYAKQQDSSNTNIYKQASTDASIPLGAIRPKLKPPNFKDDRQLPITYSFDRPILNTPKPNNEKPNLDITNQYFAVTQKPYVFMTATGGPFILSSPKQQYTVTGKPYLVSSVKPHNTIITFKQTTPKPFTAANEQLSALQQYWHNSDELQYYIKSTMKPSTVSKMPSLENLFAQAIRSTLQTPSNNMFANDHTTTTTTKAPPKRRPIPKPSPEMNDYYYDDEDERYDYEPPVKSKYMPSTEIKPQRPHMAQNYKEYNDYEDSRESSENTKHRRPVQQKPKTATKNHNDVSVVTKAPIKDSNKYNMNGRVPIPVFMNFGSMATNILMHHRNRTAHLRKPIHSDSGPHTLRPPKYLNQTTLRPYTVRHRLAKPTTVKDSATQNEDNRQVRGQVRHHNIVAQMKLTTPRDSHKQETRYTMIKQNDKTDSLEPTESVTPSSYQSPRPKMLYNGSQNYNPDQYDPYYAVYDEDGELYKDAEYVQQYNIASVRPAVQQTYRGTPPPNRRPVDAYTPRPTQQDYDDALIHGQINQNQYQSAVRQPVRGEGNELGYDNPSSVKTTIYEASSISTTPSTTSTSTTQRPSTAPITEAMTPSQYTPRSSTDENPIRDPESLSKPPSDGTASTDSSIPSPIINLSSLAKPFEKTDNSNRLQDTLPTTETLLTSRLSLNVTKNNNQVFNQELRPTNHDSKKVVSLTSGFSIRRNSNNTNNPYTLTVLTRPFDEYNISRRINLPAYSNDEKTPYNNLYGVSRKQKESVKSSEEINLGISSEQSLDRSMRRNDGSAELSSEEHTPLIYVRPDQIKPKLKTRIKLLPTPSTVPTTKYYLKTVIKRPAPFSSQNEDNDESTENVINTNALIETGLQNARINGLVNQTARNIPEFNKVTEYYDKSEDSLSKTTISPYKSLKSLRNHYYDHDDLVPEYTTTTTTTRPLNIESSNKQYTRLNEGKSSKPSYFSYRVVDEEIPDHTTEVFSSSVKNIIKAFFGNFASTPRTIITSALPEEEERVVNIGLQKKPPKFIDEKPIRNNFKRLEIITEPSQNEFIPHKDEILSITEKNKGFLSTTTMRASTTTPFPATISVSLPLLVFGNTKAFLPTHETLVSKFKPLVTEMPQSKESDKNEEIENSRKFQNLVRVVPTEQIYSKPEYNNFNNEVSKLSRTDDKIPTENEFSGLTNKPVDEFATTTSTTKSTVTTKLDKTSTTKSLSFPTRASRVNPAIKLAATNPGGGRRSYQSSSKCSSDNSLQANPKCNEIKYQRPAGTRGRGSAHYTTLNGNEPQQNLNRGTPPTRSRPTLKPSTAVVTNNNPVIDIYSYPPRRPAAVYPQPTPDKTAAKCRKDVCLLPDCYCGGKDIPGDLPVETVPQIVLLTFDDSVNDLNKGLYADLFEKGRVNPNGCPISATFYVSHEWTDYSQVQNLYAAGHEMASHTISHSFGEQFSQKKWNREVGGQREILAAYGGVKQEDVRGMRAPFLSVGGNKMFKMLHDSNFTYDSSLPVYENKPPSWPYTLDYKLFHDCMIPPCPTKSYPGVWEVPMVMWQDLNGGRCSMGDACANPPEAEGVYKMLLKNFDRHYTTNRAPFGLYYHAAWFTQPHHKEGFIMFLDFINQMSDVWLVTNWQALQWVRDPTPISRLNNFQPFQCNYQDRPKKCNNPKVCNLWHKSGVRYMRTCQPCPEIYPWTGKTGIRSSKIDNEIEE